MKQTIFVLILSIAGCSQGSSNNQNPSPSGSGGSTEASTGGTLGTASGGTTGNGVGGSTLGSGGAMDTGGSTTGTGGAVGTGGTTTGSGGAMATGGTTTGSGGAMATGGTTTGSGGAAGPDASATGGSGGSVPADARLRDGPGFGAGGATPMGGTRASGGATGAGGTTGAGGSSGACVPAANPGSSGMNTGQACLGCHKSGGQASNRLFTAAGSLYSAATGGSAVSGATITIVDANSKKITIVTGSDGNFYTNSAIAFPAKVQASKCPDMQAMPDSLTTGDCNSCHNSGMRLHLP